jgi:peptidoglycan/LPS O-acetylase OafA/YrhL
MCYSIYLVRVVVIEAMASILHNRLPLHHSAAIYGVYLPVLIAASILAGGLYYVAVERPFMSARPSASAVRRMAQ